MSRGRISAWVSIDAVFAGDCEPGCAGEAVAGRTSAELGKGNFVASNRKSVRRQVPSHQRNHPVRGHMKQVQTQVG